MATLLRSRALIGAAVVTTARPSDGYNEVFPLSHVA